MRRIELQSQLERLNAEHLVEQPRLWLPAFARACGAPEALQITEQQTHLSNRVLIQIYDSYEYCWSRGAKQMRLRTVGRVAEEILWYEAAHMLVIWATQVLESLTKQGQASRTEITAAAMGERAECVMLNKDPHIIDSA